MNATVARLRDLAGATPESRDRYVDFLRAFAILTVVVGHWMIAMIWWPAGLIYVTSAIGVTPWLWLATWFLMVMPLFFFVGGFSNLVSYDSAKRRGGSTWSWIWARWKRLLKPSLIFFAVWAVVEVGMHLLDIGRPEGPGGFLRGVRPPGATVPFGPLWFLPVYLYVIALAPVMLRLHRRFGVAVPVVLVLATVVVDVVAFAGHHHGIRYVNVFTMWLIPHQVGFFYGDGRLVKMSRRGLAVMAGCGLAALIALTNPPIYLGHGPEWFSGLQSLPKSLLGTDIEPIANTYPPTVALVAMSFWSIGLAMLLRGPLNRWLNRAWPWMVTIYVNSVIMTLYLWHMTAFLLAILLLWPLGFGREHDSTRRWWLERPLWVLVPGAFLVLLIAIFGRFERVRTDAGGRPVLVEGARPP